MKRWRVEDTLLLHSNVLKFQVLMLLMCEKVKNLLCKRGSTFTF
jgi:hypothetical protein